MGFSLKNMFEDAWADINPFDNGQTGATLRASRQKAAPVVTPPAGTRSLTVRSAAPSPATLTVADAPQSRIHPIDMASLQAPKTQPLTVAPAQPAQAPTPKLNPEQADISAQLNTRDKLDSNGRIQLYGKAMRAGVMDRSAALDAINHEVDTHQAPKVDTSLIGQVKGIAHDELQLGKDTVNGIKDGIGNTVNLAGDAILKPAISTFGNDQQKHALDEKMGQDFQGSIPGAMYRPLDLIGNTLGSSLAANKLHNEGVDDKLITRAVNDQTARNGINTNNSMFENDRKIAGAGAETALNLATMGAPVTGELQDQVGAQAFRQLDGKAVSQALAERAATNGTSKLVEAAKSGVVNSAYGAGSGVAATLQEDQIHPEDFVKNAATGAISGAVMGTATPYIHAGLATGAERATTAIDNAAARREAQHYQFAAADSPTYHVRPELINPTDLSSVDPAAVRAAEKEALNGRLTPISVAIDENGMANVVEGHDRLAALMNLGADQIPTKSVSPSALRAIKQGGYIGRGDTGNIPDNQAEIQQLQDHLKQHGSDGNYSQENFDAEQRLQELGADRLPKQVPSPEVPVPQTETPEVSPVDTGMPIESTAQNDGRQFIQNRLTKGAKDRRQNLSEETIKQVEGEHAVRNTQQLDDNAQAQTADAPLQDLIDQVHERMAVSPGKISDEDVAFAKHAIERADAEGRPNDASAIHDALSEHLVASGQTVQAASLLYQRSPQGILYKALRDIKKAGVEETPEMKRRLQSLTDNIKKAPDENAKMRAVAKLHKEVSKIIPQSKINGALSVWKAGLLSGVKTQGGNFVSNGTFGVLKTSSDPIAAAFDRAFSAFTKERTKTATQRGTFSGAKEGAGKAVDTMRTGFDERNINGGKYEEHGEIHFKNKVVQAIVGTPSNLVFRGMNAADQPFYYSALRKNLNDLAKADGMTKGLRGKELRDHMQATVADPPVAMAQKATDAAWKSVLGYDTLASKAISAVHRGIDNMPVPKGREKSTQIAKNVMHAGVNVLAPFTRVPTAFLARTLDYTPVGAIKEVAAQVANGHFNQRAMSEALGEATTGTAVIYLGASLASAGLLSGQYPTGDAKEIERWKAEKIQPNSLKIHDPVSGKDKWISLNYLGPVGLLFGAGKDYHDAAARGDSGTMAAIAGSGKNLMGQSFLTGFSGFSNAINDPQRSAKSFVNSQAGSVVPAWMNDMANLGDTKQRETNSTTDSVKARVPGVRNTLPVKQDVYGNELDQRTGQVDQWLNPLKPSEQQHSPTLDEVSRLHSVDPNNKNLEVTPTALQKKLSFGGTGADGKEVQTQLTDSQLHDLQHQVGQATQDGWSKLIKTSEYKALSDEDKAKALTNMAGDIASAEKTRYAQANSLGQYAPDFNGKNKKISKAAQVFLTGQPNATKYAKNVNAVGGNTTPISSDLGKSDADILDKYDSMTTDDRSKWFNDNKDAEYRYNQAKYNNDKASGTLTKAEDARAKAGLAKDKIGSTFSKEIRDLYGLSKEELWGVVSTDPNGKKMAEDVLAYGDALANAGVTDNKFRTSKGAAAIQPKAKGASKSSKGKSSHGISYKMTGYLDTSTTGKSLRQILADAKVTGKSKRPK